MEDVRRKAALIEQDKELKLAEKATANEARI